MKFQDYVGLGFVHSTPSPRKHFDRNASTWPIWYYGPDNEVVLDDTKGPYFPTWHMSPIIYDGLVSNENILANKDGLNNGTKTTFESDSVAISQLITIPPGDVNSEYPPLPHWRCS